GTDPQDDADAPALADVATLEKRMLDAMRVVRAKEIERGVNLVGPHRDDVVLTLGGLPAKGYASHGESWSFALALRLASYRLLKDGAPAGLDSLLWADQWGPDGEPILVLDDVFAELDVRRRERLAELVAGAGQAIITAAVRDDEPGRRAPSPRADAEDVDAPEPRSTGVPVGHVVDLTPPAEVARQALNRAKAAARAKGLRPGQEPRRRILADPPTSGARPGGR